MGNGLKAELTSRSGGCARLRCTLPVVAALAILCARPAAVRADIVVLADGRKIEGTVKREGDFYVIRGRFGTTTRVPVYEVTEIRKTESAFDEFGKRLKGLEAKGERATAEEWFGLAAFASKHNLTQQARETYEKVITTDPAHEAARKALGHVRYQGTWMTEKKAMALKGMVNVGGRWVRRDEAEQLRRERYDRRRRSRDPAATAAAAAKAFAVEYITCSKCNGSGYEIIVKCQQCARSSRPGWNNFGEYSRICTTCKGTARVPAFKCRYCRGSGKVDPNKPQRVPIYLARRERPIPGGYQRCPDCGGTGALKSRKCPQCARSQYRGIMKLGPYRFMVCTKCKGTGRQVTLKCFHCRGTGIIPERR